MTDGGYDAGGLASLVHINAVSSQPTVEFRSMLGEDRDLPGRGFAAEWLDVIVVMARGFMAKVHCLFRPLMIIYDMSPAAKPRQSVFPIRSSNS